jgi:hypothetical protein
MIKKIMAIISAAVCAGVMVLFAPGFSPEVAAHATQPVNQTPTTAAPVKKPAQRAAPYTTDSRDWPKVVCAQSWPYYERSCLRDDRQVDGIARVVRVVATDRSNMPSARR